MPASKRVCRVCLEEIAPYLPICDLTPLDIRLPDAALLCFWCREELMRFYASTEINELQFTSWLATRVLRAARYAAIKRPYKRCVVGYGNGRCHRYAVAERNGLWMCHYHQQQPSGLRHYLNWRLQRIKDFNDHIQISVPPWPRVEVTRTRGSNRNLERAPPPVKERVVISQKGSQNGNATLTEADVIRIRKRIRDGDFNTSIAHDFGVTHSMISAIRRKKAWSHLPEDDAEL